MSKFIAPTISVIMPVYNTRAYLAESVGSILNQTFRDLELIAVDDGSTDGSLELLREMARTDARLKVYHQENAGQGSARNHALKHAEGKFVYFMDSDDLLLESCFQDLLGIINEEQLDLVLFDADTLYEKGCEGQPFAYHRDGKLDAGRNWRTRELLLELLEKRIYYVSPCLFLARRSLLDGFRGFPTGIIHEDNALAMHLMLSESTARYVPQRYFVRRVRAASTMTVAYSLRNIRGYVAVCSLIRSWENPSDEEQCKLIERFLYETLESVIWLGSVMSLADKISSLKLFWKAGLAGYVSTRRWIRFFVKS